MSRGLMMIDDEVRRKKEGGKSQRDRVLCAANARSNA